MMIRLCSVVGKLGFSGVAEFPLSLDAWSAAAQGPPSRARTGKQFQGKDTLSDITFNQSKPAFQQKQLCATVPPATNCY